DESGEDERPLLEHGRARHHGIRALAVRRLRRHVERPFELALERLTVARRGDRPVDEDLERRLRGPRTTGCRNDCRNGDRERERKRKAPHSASPCSGRSETTAERGPGATRGGG